MNKFLVIAPVTAFVLLCVSGFVACGTAGPQMPQGGTQTARAGRLTARPTSASTECSPGQRILGLATDRDGIVFVPDRARDGVPLPLVVLLHGASGRASNTIGLMRSQAARDGFILLVPDARQRTWDVVLNGYGPDVDFIDRALKQVFGRCAVDPDHLAIAGFSDGASYALSLGLTNGDLFSHSMAFSPGFMRPAERVGKPHIFISHGTNDPVLPFVGARRMASALESSGYQVVFRQFEGGHSVPTDVVNEAVEWFR